MRADGDGDSSGGSLASTVIHELICVSDRGVEFGFFRRQASMHKRSLALAHLGADLALCLQLGKDGLHGAAKAAGGKNQVHHMHRWLPVRDLHSPMAKKRHT